MLRILVLVTSILLVLSCFAVAQDNPKAEIFGGYQYLRANTGVSGVDSINLNGWNASVNGFFTKNFGISADFSGIYGSPFGASTSFYTYMFGPIVRFPNSSKIQPFAHALFGASHGSVSASGLGSTSDNGFAWAAGGGVDVNVNHRFAVRLAQADYLMTTFSNTNQNNFRYSAGVVFKF